MEKFPSKPTEKAWIGLIRAQQLLLERVESRLKKAGFPPLAWYDVLLELSRDPAKGLRQFEIGPRVLLSKYNLSRLLDRLEKAGLVRRMACDTDGRGNVLVITQAGLRLKNAMWPVYADAIQNLLGEFLPAAQIRQLDEITAALLKNLASHKE